MPYKMSYLENEQAPLHSVNLIRDIWIFLNLFCLYGEKRMKVFIAKIWRYYFIADQTKNELANYQIISDCISLTALLRV